MVHIMLPFLVLPLYATMRAIDGDLVRAAIGLGVFGRARRSGAFSSQCRCPGSLPVSFWSSCSRSDFYVTPALLGGGRVQMLAQRIESTITIYANWGAASALGVILLVIALALIWAANRVFGLDKLFVR